jgi:hypothetical protein
VIDLLRDTLDATERVTKNTAFRAYDWVRNARGTNRSGNFRGMTKSRALADVGEGVGKAARIANVLLGLPGAVAHARQSFAEIDVLSRRTDLGAVESTLRFGAIVIDGGTNVAADLTGLQDVNRDVRETLRKVDEIGADPHMGVLEKTWEFGKAITKGGVKTFLDAIPFCGGLADRIEL